MSVLKRTSDCLILRSDDGDSARLYVEAYPDGSVDFAAHKDAGAEFKRDDLLVLLSWLADTLGVERHVPPPTCGNVDGWSETTCLLPPGHYGQHEGIGTRWARSEATS